MAEVIFLLIATAGTICAIIGTQLDISDEAN